MSGIQVGVRVRPFLPKIDGEDQLCVSMTDTQTICKDVLGDGVEKKFTFDYSFQSHSGYHEEANGYCAADEGSDYKDQKYVFEKIGVSVLDNAWQGYHTCLFAYGQTGSGKSHSMIGYGTNTGIVPLACTEIFNRIAANTDKDKFYEVSAMMCEIYNEKVQDLMITVNKRPNEGLKIRESKTLGIFVDGLSKHAVTSYDQIAKVMATGESHRSKGATLMNAESSRAHTIIQIEFKQIEKFQGKTAQKLSVINLVDLAGSEKAGQTGATGDRLKEGSMINKSLSCLGDVIKALVDKQNGKKGLVVPYRNSNLTRMLQNALGGNSKTYMICAIRPGAKYFDESVNTLKYADRAKQIKNKAVVNENPQDKMIRELKAENARLKKELEDAGGPSKTVTVNDEEAEKQMKIMKEQLEANQREMAEMSKSWEDKVAEQKARQEEEDKQREAEEAAKLAGTPHLVNLNEDPQLDRKVTYDIKSDEPLTAGRRNKQSNHKLQLGGTGIFPEHCTFITNPEGSIILKALDPKAMEHCKINGIALSNMDGHILDPNDRVCLGPSAIFLFKNKKNEANASMEDQDDDPISYDFAADEVANNDNLAQKEEQEKARQEQEAAAKKMVADLEAKMEAERAANMKKLADQEEMLKGLQDGAAGDEAAKARLEAEILQAKQNAENFAADKMKRLMAEGIRQKNLQAEYNRVEKELNQLLPLVNEANLAATELKRDLKFNTKMVKKLDPFLKNGNMNQGKTEILIKIDNNEEKYYYEWPADKFHNRLFMIRELLEEFFDSGNLPKLNKAEDPFWDPPNPILIGQSFLQLEPLGIQFENNLETAGILSIDGQGGKNGILNIGYSPCTVNGETEEDKLPDEFMVEDAEELIGMKNLYFKVFVRNAQGLPKHLNCNPFVTYQFKFEKDQIYSTPEVQGIVSSPNFKYEQVHKIDNITADIAKELKEGSISFMVYAYPPARNKLAQDLVDGGNAFQKRREGLNSESAVGGEYEAKVLGLDNIDDGIEVTAAKVSTVDKNTKFQRRQSFVGDGKLKIGQQVDADGKVVPQGNVAVVGQKESACCTMF